jgi:hypothetical protein
VRKQIEQDMRFHQVGGGAQLFHGPKPY